jgi:putative membrane protein
VSAPSASPPGASPAGPDGGGAPAPGTSGDELRWHRVHPVTPLVRGWAVVVAALVVVGGQTVDDLPNAAELAGRVDGLWWKIVLGVLLVAGAAFGYAALAWRMTAYAVDDDAVHLRKGIVFRQQRHARLDRLQAVDVRQPLLARLFGLAELRLEVAGGSDSGVAIGFLTDAAAARLRADLLARAAGIKAARTAAPARPVSRPMAASPSPSGRNAPLRTASLKPISGP